MDNRDVVIEVKNFTKDYGHGRGVFDINLNIKKGEFYGFLGPNGAGKSTTIRHIMGFSKPDKGTIKIFDKDINKSRLEILEHVGYLPGEVTLPSYLSGKQFIEQQLELQQIKSTNFLEYLKKKFPIELNIEIKYMSLGDKRILAIYSAFMNDPDLLVLDEPTSGLDPLSQERFKDFLLSEKKRGKTILLSSHIFKEIDDTCDRISIIKDGRIVSTFNKGDFNLENKDCYQILFADTSSFKVFMERIGRYIELINFDEILLSASVKVCQHDINDLFYCLSGLNIKMFSTLKQTLETYFLSFYKEEKEYEGL